MPSIFTRIISGEIPAYKVAQSESFLAFLDINPLTEGHTLCVPKIEVDNLFDLDEATYSGLLLFSRRVAHAVGEVIPCERVGMSVVGLEIPHAHVHLIPISGIEDMNFSRSKAVISSDRMAAIAESISGRVVG